MVYKVKLLQQEDIGGISTVRNTINAHFTTSRCLLHPHCFSIASFAADARFALLIVCLETEKKIFC